MEIERSYLSTSGTVPAAACCLLRCVVVAAAVGAASVCLQRCCCLPISIGRNGGTLLLATAAVVTAPFALAVLAAYFV